jgi:hypothetical protein
MSAIRSRVDMSKTKRKRSDEDRLTSSSEEQVMCRPVDSGVVWG